RCALHDAVAATIGEGFRPARSGAGPARWPIRRGAIHFALFDRPESSFDRADDALLDHGGRQAIERSLERIAGEHFLAVDPGFTFLPVHIVTEQNFVHLVHIRVVREHDVPGVIERKPAVLDRPAAAADTIVLLDQQRVFTQMKGRAQARRTRAGYNYSALHAR